MFEDIIKRKDVVNASNALIYRDTSCKKGYKQFFNEDPVYVVLSRGVDWVMVRHHSLDSGITGFFKIKDLKKVS